MGTFCITRKAFLNRAMDMEELTALADMLREWYGLRAPLRAAQSAQVVCAARIYAVPRPAIGRIRDALVARLPAALVEAESADEILMTGPATRPDAVSDVSVWREVLAEPLVQTGCVLLTLKIEGQVIALNGRPGDMSQTFVLCGQPVSGAILLKAIWELKYDPAVAMIYRGARWSAEQRLLEAFETYRRDRGAGRATAAAIAAIAAFSGPGNRLFAARRDERRIMRQVRQQVELPDDKGVVGFARRAGLPLAIGVGVALLPVVIGGGWIVAIASLVAAAFWFVAAGKIIWKKFQRVRRYYTNMRLGLGALHSKPIEYELTDLSADRTPSLLKAAGELEAMGAKHVCDISMKTARQSFDGNRIYALGHAGIAVALLRQYGALSFFPAKPVIVAATRFADGRRHVTTNVPNYRKSDRPELSSRCVPDAEVEAVVARHRTHVDRMIARGAAALPPPTSPQEVIAENERENNAAREAWQRSPYSWGDALHQSFNVCRREYLAD